MFRGVVVYYAGELRCGCDPSGLDRPGRLPHQQGLCGEARLGGGGVVTLLLLVGWKNCPRRKNCPSTQCSEILPYLTEYFEYRDKQYGI